MMAGGSGGRGKGMLSEGATSSGGERERKRRVFEVGAVQVSLAGMRSALHPGADQHDYVMGQVE